MTSAEAALAHYGGRAHTALLDALPDGNPGPWLYELLRRYPERNAKGIRPTLCLAACEAFGGQIDDALGVAVAIELLHNAFLIHDDIADGSLRRRGAPTLHHEVGVGLAINAGDALGAFAQRHLRGALDPLSAGVAERVLAEFDLMLMRTVEGQATELGWVRDGVAGLTPEDYLDLIMHKTCWYTTIHPLRVGAIIGSGVAAATAGVDRPAPDLDAMIRFGFHLGAAFQIRDDLLNLVGDERYGKEIGGDLVEGKRTLMLIHLQQHARGADREQLERYLAVDPSERESSLIDRVRALMDDYGSIEFAVHYAEGIASEADAAFARAFAPVLGLPVDDVRRTAAEAIGCMIPYMLDRHV